MAPLLWAVHISDGLLTLPWVVGGFALAAVLAAWGAWRIRDEEIPRIALLSAAFFTASLLHVRLGPTSAHLLLNGLVGVLLGRRALLAIPLGLFLQAVLFMHGGFTTLGVNACVMALPALLAGWLFAALHRLSWFRRPAFRTALVAAGTLAWVLGGVFLVAVIATNRWTELRFADLGRAWEIVRHPIPLGAAVLAALAAAWGERRLKAAPEFALGFVVGAAAVLATVTLNALVLLLGGGEDWHQVVTLVVLAHLPLVPLEGVIVGFTVGFLARVKPDLLGIEEAQDHWTPPAAEPSRNGFSPHPEEVPGSRAAVRPPAALLLAPLILAATAGTAHAHRLNAAFEVVPGGKVKIESWYDITEQSPVGARVEVFRPDNRLLVAGKTDANGMYVFEYTKAEPLRVVVSAGAGHRCEIDIPADKLSAPSPTEAPSAPEPTTPDRAPAEGRSFADRRTDVGPRDVLLGVTFLLALAAFVLSLRNARKRG